jgi:hypothetical protein
MFPTEDRVRDVIGPHEQRIVGVFERAWKRLSESPERVALEYKRTVATLMHQFVVHELRREYHGDKSVHLIEENETVRMLINREAVIRFKKMDERGYTRAQPTLATMAFTTPNSVLPFDSEYVPERFTADVGYVLNDLGTRIDHILVAARNGDAVLWSYEIPRATPMADFIIPVAPTAPSSPASIISVPGAPAEKKQSEG